MHGKSLFQASVRMTSIFVPAMIKLDKLSERIEYFSEGYVSEDISENYDYCTQQ